MIHPSKITLNKKIYIHFLCKLFYILFSIDISTVFSKNRGAGLTSTFAIVDGTQSLRRMSSIRRTTFGSLSTAATLKRKLTCIQIRFAVVNIIFY